MPETSRTAHFCPAAALGLVLAGMAAAQNSVLHISVLSGEGGVYAAGSRAAKPVTIEVTDETGRPVEGARVSFQVPAEGPGGLFPNGLRTDVAVTDSSGRAALRAILLNRTPGPFTIRITAVKEQSRAGIVTRQYIGEGKQAAAAKENAVAMVAPDQKQPHQAADEKTPPAQSDSASVGNETRARSRSSPVIVTPGKKQPQPVIVKEAPANAEQTPKTTRVSPAADTTARPRSATVPTIILTDGRPRSGSPSGLSAGHKSHKWLWVGLLAAGGAAGGFFGSGMAAAAAHSTPAAAATPAAVSIGVPTISIGRP